MRICSWDPSGFRTSTQWNSNSGGQPDKLVAMGLIGGGDAVIAVRAWSPRRRALVAQGHLLCRDGGLALRLVGRCLRGCWPLSSWTEQRGMGGRAGSIRRWHGNWSAPAHDEHCRPSSLARPGRSRRCAVRLRDRHGRLSGRRDPRAASSARGRRRAAGGRSDRRRRRTPDAPLRSPRG